MSETDEVKQSEVIFVDLLTGDNNQGDGTEAAPYRTVTYALSAAGVGDLIQVRAGTSNKHPIDVYKDYISKRLKVCYNGGQIVEVTADRYRVQIDGSLVLDRDGEQIAVFASGQWLYVVEVRK